MRWMIWALAIAVACGDDDGTARDAGGDTAGDAGMTAQGAVAHFEPSDASAMAFGDVPFPHDLYLGSDGRVALEALPAATSSMALDSLLAAVRSQTGFCVICSTHFFIDGELDFTRMPSTLVASATEPIVMADVDPASPERGRLFALELQWLAGRLTVRPALGTTLHRNRRYAVALTSSVRAADGTPLAGSPRFLEARDGTDTTDAGVVRARAILEPAFTELATAGVDRSRIVSLAVFTTADPTVATQQLREAVHSAPAPVATVDVVYPNATTTLDGLMGVPSETRFGFDVPATGGAMGEIGIVHDSTSRVVIGSFTGARVVTGSAPDVGIVARDATGRPMVTGTESIPFLLIVPEGADVTSLPVVVVGHGSPRTMMDGLAFADTFGAAGIAVLAYDAYQHGGRSATAVDMMDPRGRMVPDGISEHDGMSVLTRIQGVQGVPEGMEASVSYLEGSFTQVHADAFAAIRFASEGDLSAIAASDAALTGLAFDRDAIFYAGQSFGTTVGGGLLAAEPELDAMLLNVPGGSIAQIVAGAARTRAQVDILIVPLLGMRGTFDETSRRLLLEPMMDLFSWILQGVDGHALAPYAYRDPVLAGPRPDLLVQIAELDDFLPVPGAQSHFASMGIERIGPFDFVPGVAEATRPVSANVMTPAGDVTAVAHLFEGASHRMLAFRNETVDFAEPIVPPFMRLAEPRMVVNPVEEEHLEIRRFFASRVMTGRATVE